VPVVSPRPTGGHERAGGCTRQERDSTQRQDLAVRHLVNLGLKRNGTGRRASEIIRKRHPELTGLPNIILARPGNCTSVGRCKTKPRARSCYAASAPGERMVPGAGRQNRWVRKHHPLLLN